jgi:hypothetical protein
MRAKHFIVGMLVSWLFLVFAVGYAHGQSPTQDAYGGALGEQISSTPGGGSAGASPSNAASSGNLPFTGAQLGLGALIGLGLVVVGITMRQATRRPQP